MLKSRLMMSFISWLTRLRLPLMNMKKLLLLQKELKGLAAILKKVPMRRSPIELTSHQRATNEIVAYSDLPLEETGSQTCHELFVFIV